MEQLTQIPYFVLIENLGSSSSALETSIMDLRNITATLQTGNQDMLRLAGESRKDSTMVKSLTFITIFYMPATLIAVSLDLATRHLKPYILIGCPVRVDYLRFGPHPT
jgi:hypothetical protein